MLPKMLTILDFQEVFILEDPVLNLTVQAKIYIFVMLILFYGTCGTGIFFTCLYLVGYLHF